VGRVWVCGFVRRVEGEGDNVLGKLASCYVVVSSAEAGRVEWERGLRGRGARSCPSETE